MPKKVLFRFDASPAIGGGHAVRCLTLAAALQAEGWEIAIATADCSRLVVPRVLDYPIVNITSADNAESIGDKAGKVDLLIVDHYALDAGFELAAKAWAGTIMAIDDLANRPHVADILLDQTPGRTRQDYIDCIPSSSVFLAGPDYALLRTQFAIARNIAFNKRSGIEKGVKNVLVNVGGSDPNGILLTVLKAIDQLKSEFTIDLVLGGNTPVPRFQGNFDGRLKIYQNVGNMALLMSKADLAVGAGGISSLERCCLGLPTLLLVTTDNQRLMGARLSELGAARVLGLREEISSTNVSVALRDLILDPDILDAMSIAAFNVCDGLGVKRVMNNLAPCRLTSGEAVRLRRASIDDSDLLYEWQVQPGIRQYFRTTTPPSPEEHRKWLFDCLGRPLCVLNIVELDGIPCGMLRIEPFETGEVMDVSLLISSEFQGRGVGKASLKLASELLPWVTLRAEIHRDNYRSRSTFEAAGFSSTDGIYYFSRRA